MEGFQWRHAGADYNDMDTDYTGQGIDQLQGVIEKIRNTPYDRDILIGTWVPTGKDEYFIAYVD